jgi:hypothetical protein
MGRACRMHGIDDRLMQNIMGDSKGRDVGERMLLKWILKKES